MACSGFKRAFVCLKTAFLSRFWVSKAATGQWIRAQAAIVLIVLSEALHGLASADFCQRNIALQDLTLVSYVVPFIL